MLFILSIRPEQMTLMILRLILGLGTLRFGKELFPYILISVGELFIICVSPGIVDCRRKQVSYFLIRWGIASL